MGTLSIDPLEDDGRARRQAQWDQYLKMSLSLEQDQPAQVETTKHAGETRQATEMDAQPQMQQQFQPQTQTTKDVVEATRVGKDWTKRIKTVPKATQSAKVRDLRSYEPADSSRGAKQAATQHKYMGHLLGAHQQQIQAFDKQLAAFAQDSHFPRDAEWIIPHAIAERENLLKPIAAAIGANGNAEDQTRFAIYNQWSTNIVSIAKQRLKR